MICVLNAQNSVCFMTFFRIKFVLIKTAVPNCSCGLYYNSFHINCKRGKKERLREIWLEWFQNPINHFNLKSILKRKFNRSCSVVYFSFQNNERIFCATGSKRIVRVLFDVFDLPVTSLGCKLLHWRGSVVLFIY